MNEITELYNEEIETNNGFKKTKIGWIPDDWEVKMLGDTLKIITVPYKYKTEEYLDAGLYPIIDQGKKGVKGFCNNKETLVNTLPLVLFGDHTKEVKYIDFPFACGADGTKLLTSNKIDIGYLFQLMILAAKRLPELGYSRHYSELKNIHVAIPPKIEQQKVACILSDWDEAIRLKKDLLQSQIFFRKGLEQNLFSGNLRLKEFVKNNDIVKTKIGNLPKDWNLKPLSKVLTRIKEKLIPIDLEEYRQIGIRSHCKGIFHKEAVSGESLGNKSVFWIKPDCFVVNIVFAWEHAIAKTTINEDGMIASHRFPMYQPNESLDLDFLLFFFKTAMGKHLLGLASPGGAGRNKTLGQVEFIKLKIPVPSLEEQKNIVSILNASENEIDLLKLEIQTLEEQKKGLMQQLLTGKIRVNKN